jgi:signal transduction histidine kinase
MIANEQRLEPTRQIKFTTDPDVAPVLANPGYLDQILINLLSNARKYGDPESPIEVVLARAGDCAELTVRNTGTVISAEAAERIFEAFFRDRAHSRAEGVGLGLAVCRRLVTAMHGEIRAVPRSAGGLDVMVNLPLLSEE